MENDQHDTTSSSLTLITYNCEHADDSRVDFITYLVQKCDFLSLQEH